MSQRSGADWATVTDQSLLLLAPIGPGASR